jgi:hypothetical protein
LCSALRQSNPVWRHSVCAAKSFAPWSQARTFQNLLLRWRTYHQRQRREPRSGGDGPGQPIEPVLAASPLPARIWRRKIEQRESALLLKAVPTNDGVAHPKIWASKKGGRKFPGISPRKKIPELAVW